MNKAWQKYVDMASGLTNVTRKRAEQVVRGLVKQGEIATDRAEKAVDELLSRSESNRKAVASIVRSETERAVGRLGLARQKDLEKLERKIDKLAKQGSGGARTAKKASKKGAKKSAKKAPAKKSSAAKRARSTAAKKTAERARPAKKSAPPKNPTSEES